jgi:Tfp pilus assembly protein PilO
MKSSLTKAQQKTLIYIIGTVLLLGAAGGLMVDANRRTAEARTLRMDADRQQQEASALPIPSEQEQVKWSTSEKELSTRLLSDQQVPEFLEDITRIANENHLERLGINNVDKVNDPSKPGTPEDVKLAALGIHRYLLVTLKFQSVYPDAARFLAAVSRLPRPVELQTIDMRRNPPKLDVTLVLKVYKQQQGPA